MFEMILTYKIKQRSQAHLIVYKMLEESFNAELESDET